MTEDIDLIVPEVNQPEFKRGIIANPNCSTIQSVVPLKVLQDQFGLKRVHIQLIKLFQVQVLKVKEI